MKLCFINPSTVERPETYDLAKHLPAEYDVTILQPCHSGNRTREFELTENVRVRRVSSLFAEVGNSVLTLPCPNSWINELLAAVRAGVDLVHVCDYEYFTSVYPLLVKKRHDVPMIIVNDSLLGVGGYSLGSYILNLMSSYYTMSIGKKILQGYDRVVLLYSELAKYAQKIGVPPLKTSIIPNGVDIDEIDSYKKSIDASETRRKFGFEDAERVVLFVGRLVKVKRVHMVISVVQKLLKQGYKVKALIVGDGPLRRQLEELASPVRDHVTFTGFLFAKEKYEAYSAANLLMLPSESEGLPSVLLESSSMGLPAVSTNVNGVPDIVVHNKTGFLVGKSDLELFEKYVKALVENEDIAKKMGKNAREYVKANFLWSTIANKYKEIYQSMVL